MVFGDSSLAAICPQKAAPLTIYKVIRSRLKVHFIYVAIIRLCMYLFLQKYGFFIEVGALDGERSSNTIELEKKFGWSGLLIEMDPYYYTQLRGKSRHAWSINACVSPYDHPTVVSVLLSS